MNDGTNRWSVTCLKTLLLIQSVRMDNVPKKKNV